MANIKVVQRKVNKSEEQPISVRYSHPNPTTKKNEDFFLATGVIVSPQYFKDGKVITLGNAPELNQTIRAVVTRLEQALRDIVQDSEGIEPEVRFVKFAYHKRPVLVESLKTRFETFKDESLSKIELLEIEIKELNDLIATKQAEIIELKKQTGTYRTSNLVELIQKMIEARTKDDDTSKGGKRPKRSDKEAKLSKNTINAYNTFLNVVKEWNPSLLIEKVDKKAFQSFEAFCIKLGYYNNSIHLFMQKFGSTMAYYLKAYELSDDYKNYTFDLPLREEQVIYLTSEELKAFRNVAYTHWQSTAVKKYQMVKDLALIMSETGLRLNDAILSKGDISNGYIVKRQSKTNGKVVIPFSDRVKSILEKYNYQMKVGNVGYWNDAFRTMLSMCTHVPSLFEEVTVVNWSGHNKIEDTRMKWEHCSAHSLRRSMINQCLLRGYRYDQITLITGHKDFNVFQSYVDRNSTLEKLDEAFNYLNDVSVVGEAIMKVA